MWLLPTKRRLDNVKRFLGAAREMGTGTPGLILVNRDEYEELSDEYEQLKLFLIDGWSFLPVDADSYGAALRAVWDRVKNLDWIGLVCDDLVPSTSGWDKALLDHLRGWNVVSSNDGWQAPQRMHGAIVWSGPLARAAGWIFPPKFRHIFHDDVWETIGRETACWSVRMDVMVRHLHESMSGVIGPTMDRESALWKHDEACFKEWLANDKDACVARVRDLLKSCGVKLVNPDFSGMSVMIGTPSISGEYEGDYVTSLHKTMEMLRFHGVSSAWYEQRYTADIAYARSQLISAFLRSNFSHMLMIDADMSWEFDAVVRLVVPKKDFVAVAGPKKRYPLSFAASWSDDNGTPLPLIFDDEIGVCEVSEIGLAFALITRRVAEGIATGYPELGFKGLTGEQEYGFCIPMVENERWFSEDFAFCRRWRRLGHQVFFCPDVPLGHTGKHKFHGSFAQAQAQQGAFLRAAAE